jgi:hypothetical protein
MARFYISQSVLAIESIHKHNYIHRSVFTWNNIFRNIRGTEVS